MLDWLFNPGKRRLLAEHLTTLRSLAISTREHAQRTITYYEQDPQCYLLQGRGYDLVDSKTAAAELLTAIPEERFEPAATGQGPDRVCYARQTEGGSRGFRTGLIFIRVGADAYARLFYKMEWD